MFAIGIAVIVAVAVVSGLTTMAVSSSYGSQDDPLVTLSYLNETVTPAIKEELGAILDERLTAMAQELGISGDVTDPSQGSTEPSGFAVLTLNAGQTVVCGVGTEIMPRIGSVESVGPDYPRLIDEAGSETVGDEGVVLSTNHMYMVTINGNGVRALEDFTKILIRGEYTVEDPAQ